MCIGIIYIEWTKSIWHIIKFSKKSSNCIREYGLDQNASHDRCFFFFFKHQKIRKKLQNLPIDLSYIPPKFQIASKTQSTQLQIIYFLQPTKPYFNVCAFCYLNNIQKVLSFIANVQIWEYLLPINQIICL